jgi:hypothetical protein
MRRTLFATLLAALALPSAAHAVCGPARSLPLPVEYAEPSVAPAIRTELFARPGLVLATSGPAAAELRNAGAHPFYWQMRLWALVGRTTAPADPATITAAADRLYAFARAATRCDTPGIALNELEGAWLPTPWSPTNAQYRANVLALLRRLHERGARPFLLVTTSRAPFTEAWDAAEWWRQVGAVADVVLQVHFDSRPIAAAGPVVGSRRRRTAMRRVLDRFEAIGLPTTRLGLLHGFQSGPGTGGREGLPLADWLRVVKWEALAARQVATERAALGTPLGTDWSWGWGDFPTLSPVDPDKPVVACVWLWLRDPALCDGPGRAASVGAAFEASVTEGQLALPSGVHCVVEAVPAAIQAGSVDRLAAVTGDRQAALDILFARLVEWRHAAVPWRDVLRSERRIVASRFRGRRAAYVRALTRRKARLGLARALIADQLRRRLIARRLPDPAGFAAWAHAERARALETTSCVGDEVPIASADVDPAASLPFLRVPGG